MVVETVPKEILDKLDAGVEVVNPAGTGLTSLNYGSSDAGTTWYPHALGVDGHLLVDIRRGGWLGCAFIRRLGFTFSHTGAGLYYNTPQDFMDDNSLTYLRFQELGEGTIIVKFLVLTTTTFSSLNCEFEHVHEAGDEGPYQTKLEYSVDDISYTEIFDETGGYGHYTKTATDITAKYFKLTLYFDGAGTGARSIYMKIFNLYE